MSMTLSLPDELVRLIEAKVESGRYGSSSDVVREALRLLDEQDEGDAAKLRWLRLAWQGGLDSGDVGEIDFAALKAEGRRKLGAKF
jgi:antitoxin ParD1/3/4